MNGRALLQFLVVVAVWGTSWLAIALQLGAVNPTWSVAYRFALGAAALIGWCLLRGMPLRLPRAGWGFVVVLAIAQFVLNFNLVYRAETYIPSGLVAVAYALLVPANALFARLFLARPVSPRLLLGSALGLSGTLLMFANQAAGMNGAAWKGILLAVLAVTTASCANVMQVTRLGRTLPPLATIAWAMLVGAALNAALALVVAGPPQWDPRPQYLGAVLMLGLLASALAFAVYYDLIRAIGPAEAAWTSVLIPVVAMTLSTVAEGYRWSFQSAAGAVLAMLGMAIALRSPPGRRPVPDAAG